MRLAEDPVAISNVSAWHDTADVVVIGYGIAGACAALEARRAGSDVLVIERASGGGGTSAISSGYFYLGGGTAVQQATRDEDSPEEMFKFLEASTEVEDTQLLRLYCDHSVEHFNWLEVQGVPFERSAYRGKVVSTTTTECLTSTGNEKVWPYREIARPCPRGHRVAMAGDAAGAKAMEALLSQCNKEQVRASYDSRALALIVDANRVVGVRLRQFDRVLDVKARKGVIIATGGFASNPEMIDKYTPYMRGNTYPIGVPYNDGAGIQLGLSVGAATQAMDKVMPTASFYPPGQLIKGILVNANGERFVTEDSYHGRTAAFIMEQPGGTAYLIVDTDIFAHPELEMFGHTLVDGWETIGEMEAGLKLPKGSLERTLAEYNRDAAAGEDKRFHKHPDWLKPLTSPPYAAFDVSFQRSTYFFFTLGGLKVNAHGAVLDSQGTPIPGLYAAGACASTIPRDAKGYASGLSLGAGSFFGRIAGRSAAK
jgi:succinate dehydrogenase/fumarate reductase flavoprotein subunit